MKNKIKCTKVVFIIILIIIINYNIISYGFEEEENTDYIWLEEEISSASANAVNEPKLNSKCAVVLDRGSKTVLFGKNENKMVPMASTTKIMTAIVLMENMEKKGLSLNTQVEVCKKAGSIQGSRLGLKTGDKISINDLLYGLMLCSRK